MNKNTTDLIREIGVTSEKTCEAFAKELESGNLMRQYELLSYSNELEKFLKDHIEKKFGEIRASIFSKTKL